MSAWLAPRRVARAIALVALVLAPARGAVQSTPLDLGLAREVARALASNAAEARRLASADASLAREAAIELAADEVLVRLYATLPYAENEAAALALLADVSNDEVVRGLAAKLARVARGANPFAAATGEAEAALGAACAVEQIEDTSSAAGAVEQRKRVEAALEAAHAAGVTLLEIRWLDWLGLYAIQGGDVAAARERFAAAAALAGAAGYAHAIAVSHAGLARAADLDGDAATAAREAKTALDALPAEPRTVALRSDISTALADYATKAGDRPGALAAAKTSYGLLVAANAPARERAEALERIGQLHAQGASSSRDDARAGAEALAKAADAWQREKANDRAALDLTAAGVLLVENVGGRGARAYFDRARALAVELRSPDLTASLDYWIGRSHLAEAAGASGAAETSARARAVAAFDTALKGVAAAEKAGQPHPDLRLTVNFWRGRALLESPKPDARAAAASFEAAFEAALEMGEANDAVACAEMAIRSATVGGGAAAAAARANALYDRLVASERIDPANAARALALALERARRGAAGLDPAAVALYERAAAAVPAERRAAVRAALVLHAAEARDGGVLAKRATPVFDELVAAGASDAARDLALAIAKAWLDLEQEAEAAAWLARYAPLAEKSYALDVAAKRYDAALDAATGLALAARSRNDAAAEKRWATVALDIRETIAEALEADGRLGLASSMWRERGDAARAAGDAAAAHDAYSRAAGIAAKIGDRESEALALAGRSGAELEAKDATAALATARAALALAANDESAQASADPLASPLPPAAEIEHAEAAASALRALAEACAALARDEPDGSRRQSLDVRAAEARALALELSPSKD